MLEARWPRADLVFRPALAVVFGARRAGLIDGG